jgi:hypothetical protein
VLTRLETLGRSPFCYRFAQFRPGFGGLWVEILPTKKHFFTLAPTLEDDFLTVKENSQLKQPVIPMKLRTYGHFLKPPKTVFLIGLKHLRATLKEEPHVYTCV